MTGAITNFVAAKRDTTRERTLERQVQQAQRMEAVGRLAGGVAHDINNIVQAIFGFCELLSARIHDDIAARHDVAEIRRAATRAAGLTRQLLAFGRRQLIAPCVLDLNEVVLNTEKMLERLLGEDVVIVNELAPGLRSVRADAGNLEQIIVNLAVNARDAMPGGGRLTFTTANLRVDEAAATRNPDARPGEFVRLSIRDTGTGMSPETLAQIFEPFFTTKDADKGTGLGLAVIYGIVRQHEGWIAVETQPGRGSVFHVHLPACAEEPKALEVAAGPAVPLAEGARERILVIEDDIVVGPVIVRFLQMARYEVFLAGTAAAARGIFDHEQGRFDALVTDVVLPDGNGFDMAGEFRARSPGLRVIISSGYTDERARWGDTQASGYLFLQKPYVAAELLEMLRDLFARRG